MKLIAWTDTAFCCRVTADEAAKMHVKGDRYIDPLTGKLVQLHISRQGSIRNHFEFMRNQEQK